LTKFEKISFGAVQNVSFLCRGAPADLVPGPRGHKTAGGVPPGRPVRQPLHHQDSGRLEHLQRLRPRGLHNAAGAPRPVRLPPRRGATAAANLPPREVQESLVHLQRVRQGDRQRDEKDGMAEAAEGRAREGPRGGEGRQEQGLGRAAARTRGEEFRPQEGHAVQGARRAGGGPLRRVQRQVVRPAEFEFHLLRRQHVGVDQGALPGRERAQHPDPPGPQVQIQVSGEEVAGFLFHPTKRVADLGLVCYLGVNIDGGNDTCNAPTSFVFVAHLSSLVL
jgi:hypothetical protein